MKLQSLLFVILLYCNLLSSQSFLPTSNGKIIEHQYYTLSYVENNEQAEWVYYELTPEMINGCISRTDDFREDKMVPSGSSSLQDYKGSGYDRGHLAPAGDMKLNTTSMSESFYMSNMSPQAPAFNRGGWKNLESLVRSWGLSSQKLIIVTGGILKYSNGSIGENKVTIPGYYYKIIYDPANEKMIGFKMPNEKISNELNFYVVSVDLIESETNIDFFPQIEDSLETKLESSISKREWNFTSSSSTSSKSSNFNSSSNSTTAVQCKGIAKSTGQRCKNKTTNANGYCHVHQSQSPDCEKSNSTGYSGQCCATTKSGTRCKRQASGGTKYCWQHQK